MRNTLIVARAGLVCALLVGHPWAAFAEPPVELTEADRVIARADRQGIRLLRILDQTRRAHDLAQIACVDQRLSQLNSFSRTLITRRGRLRAAIATGDRRAVRRERRIIRRVADELSRVVRAGLACVYAPAGQPNRTVVEMTVSPEIERMELHLPRRVRD